MQDQNFKTHARFVPGFHFLSLGLSLTALVLGIIVMVQTGITLESAFMVIVGVVLGLFFLYIRQFATGNQDRIIRAEENFRCYRLTGKLLDERLSRGQVIALRFAADDEYVALTEKAIKESLSITDIKKAIQQWRADHHRV